MIYERVSRIVPQTILKAFEKELYYLDINVSDKNFVGFVVAFGFFLSLGLAANAYYFFGVPLVLAFIFLYALMFVGTFLWLSLAADAKGKYVESILPDALQLIASNMKSGLTAERALLLSARKEFGPLEKELREAAKRIIAGQPLHEALLVVNKRIKSVSLERTLWLISEGMKSGGQIADLLMQISDDLRQEQSLHKEIEADISIYIILIFAASAFGAPLLFGISSFIVEVLGSKLGSLQGPDLSSVPVSAARQGGIATSFAGGAGSVISTDFVFFFSIVSLLVTSVFAALTIGVIQSGKEKNGAKFIPLIMFVSFAIFFVIRWFLLTTFSDLITVS